MFTKVLVTVDLREESFGLEALHFAVEQTQKDNAELFVLTVLPELERPSMDYHEVEDSEQEIERAAHEQLEALVKQHVPEGIRVTKIVRKGGAPHEEILRQASQQHVDLIVIPSHDRGVIEGFFMGSRAVNVVRHAHCSVMVIRKPRKA